MSELLEELKRRRKALTEYDSNPQHFSLREFNAIIASIEERDELAKRAKSACEPWAELDTSIKAICAKHGIETEWDKEVGFKPADACVQELSEKLAASEAAAAQTRGMSIFVISLLKQWVEKRMPNLGGWENQCPFCGATTPCGDIPHKPSCIVPLCEAWNGTQLTGWLSPSEAQALRDEVERLQSQIDLNRDEFERIAAIMGSLPNSQDQWAPTFNEINGVCKRSQERITQNVSVIQQRDLAQSKLAAAEKRAEDTEKLKAEAAALRRVIPSLIKAAKTDDLHYELCLPAIALAEQALSTSAGKNLLEELAKTKQHLAEALAEIHRLSPSLTPIFTHAPDAALSLPEETTEDAR